MKEMLIKNGINNKIIVVGNRVNLKLFTPPKEQYSFNNNITFVSLGSFVERKGHFLLIELVKKLQYMYPNIKLVLIGGGPLKEKYISLTKDLKNFKFIDNIPQKEIVNILKKADIYLHPSYSEAVPRAIIEAMAMGLPIVASDAGMTSGLIKIWKMVYYFTQEIKKS